MRTDDAPLSERLEECIKSSYASIPGDHDDLLREAAELARRVERAPTASVDEERGGIAMYFPVVNNEFKLGDLVRLIPVEGDDA